MKIKPFKLYLLIALIALFFTYTGCKNQQTESSDTTQKDSLSFDIRTIADSVTYLWARCPADITGDGIMDLVLIDQNANGGNLAYYEGSTDSALWKKIIIRKKDENNLFASGDLECADIDYDGDIDVLGVKHPGEWSDAGAEAGIYWYENPGWQEHFIGISPDAVKDINLSDFNSDKKMDIVIATYDESTLSVFRQDGKDEWERVLFLENYGNIHEGMDVGDLNGDDLVDIVVTGNIFYNPGGDLTSEWKHDNIDEIWNNQEGDWSRNATKVFIRDIDEDNRAEIFMSHSERSGYPLVYYKLDEGGNWKKNVIDDSIAACHTLQVFDFDLDGDYDVLAGMNRGRAVNLGYDQFDVFIFLSDNDYSSWTPKLLDTKGIYNGQAADYDGDGDYDIFRYFSHGDTRFYLMENLVVNRREHRKRR